MSKTLLLLGGSRYLVPVIEAAHEMGHRVVTCDYLPDNYAHALADEYRNASIVDKEAVVEVARAVRADGVMSFAADPGVVSAAYAAEALGLPFQGSYDTVRTLQNKSLFRAFLREHGFTCPQAFSFDSADAVMRHADDLPYPCIVKPTDSAGSKGVSRVDDPSGLRAAAEEAFAFSLSGTCIVEEFVEKAGCSSDADGFTIDGRFTCVSFTDQLFDEEAGNPYAPMAYRMPASMPAAGQRDLTDQLQRLADELGLRSGVYNIETRVGVDGRGYLMEVSPRGGGNRLSEMLRYASDADLIRASVCAALGERIESATEPRYDGCWYQQMLYSRKSGVFRGVETAAGIDAGCVREVQLWVEPGDAVHAFESANYAIGSAFLRFDTRAQMDACLGGSLEPIRVLVDEVPAA